MQDVWSLRLDCFSEKLIEIEPVQEHHSTDTKPLLFRRFDEQIELTQGFASRLSDSRIAPDRRCRSIADQLDGEC